MSGTQSGVQTSFGALSPGDTFEKMEPVGGVFVASEESGTIKATRLSDGSIYVFSPETSVLKVPYSYAPTE